MRKLRSAHGSPMAFYIYPIFTILAILTNSYSHFGSQAPKRYLLYFPQSPFLYNGVARGGLLTVSYALKIDNDGRLIKSVML